MKMTGGSSKKHDNNYSKTEVILSDFWMVASHFLNKRDFDMNNLKDRVHAALSVIDAHEAFKRAINNTGLVAPEVIVNGRIMPFAGLNKQPHNKAARCFLFDDLKGGWFMDYSTGMFETWRSDSTKPFTKADCIAFKQQCNRDRIERDKQQATVQQQTAQKAAYIWQHAKPINDQHDHQYLIKKGIQPHGARLYKGALVIPLFDQNSQLTNLQLIQADVNHVVWALSAVISELDNVIDAIEHLNEQA